MLRFSLSLKPGRVEVASDEAVPLRQLAARFVTASGVDHDSCLIDVADFMLNIDELTTWSGTTSDVTWEPRLLELVEGNVEDEGALRAALAGERMPPAEIPSTGALFGTLTSEQRRDIGRMLNLRHGANFSVPGAGKTRAALAVFKQRLDAGEVRRLLVVAPKSAFESWVSEVGECLHEDRLDVRLVPESGVDPAADILLVNYERLPELRGELIGWLATLPALLILDEAHRVKLGARGAWGSAALAMAPFATHRLILSGTPAPNGADDLKSLFSFVWPGMGARTVEMALGSSTLAEASKTLRPTFVRTTKAELNLPPLDIVVRRVPMAPLHEELYNALRGTLADETRQGRGDLESLGRVLMYMLMAATSPALLAAGASPYDPLAFRIPPLDAPEGGSLQDLMTDLPQYELSAKYKEALAIVAENASSGRKTLVWSTFVRNLTSLNRFFGDFKPAMVHGGTVDRDAEIARFRTDDDCMVLLSNPATLGEGISLHHDCHDAIYIDRDFASGRFLQSLDRIHRLGLASDVLTKATVLVSTGTIDEVIEARLAQKLLFLGRVLDDPSVVQLGDLYEEPTAGDELDSSDVQALLQHLSFGHAK